MAIEYYPSNHGRLVRWRKSRACDVGEAKERSENELWRRWSNERVGEELWRRWSDGKFGQWARLILQPFRRFTYVITHPPTLPSLYLRHSSFSNPSVPLPTSHLILQPFRRFTYVTAHSPTLQLLHLRHSSFSNPSFTSPTSQALHLIHLSSCPCNKLIYSNKSRYVLMVNFILLSSDIRSVGSISIVKKFEFDIFMIFWFYITHSLKMCFSKNVCVFVCLSVRHRS